MATNREKQPQLGFWDDEVKLVSHDTIVMWAYENAEAILRSYLESLPDDHYYKDALLPHWNLGATARDLLARKPDFPPIPQKPGNLVTERILERVIQQQPEHGRSMPRILGYADLVIRWDLRSLGIADEKEWYQQAITRNLLVEAKTTLPSIGELMRQINLYRLVYQDVVVIAPDDRYRSILADQGVHFIQYQEGKYSGKT